jgi:hypothetical protein
MANSGSWPSIAQYGLLTTEQIVRSADLSDIQINELLMERRPQSVPIEHPQLGAVTIRDQKPLNLRNLERLLTDMSVDSWIETLNDRVFFWLHAGRLAELLAAKAYRGSTHDVITIDTGALLASDASNRIRLSSLNSGSTIYPTGLRGRDTFQTVDRYDFDYMRRRRGNDRSAIAELAIIDGLPNIMDFVIHVERRQQDRVIDVLYEGPVSK